MVIDTLAQRLQARRLPPVREGVSGDTGDPRQFAGEERDFEIGFNYFGARYYEHVSGRFTSPDIPGVDQDPFDPQSWNLYTYVRNNPLRYVDPTGRKCENGYDPERGVFCSRVEADNPYRRAQEAWADALAFFRRSQQYFQAQLFVAQQRTVETVRPAINNGQGTLQCAANNAGGGGLLAAGIGAALQRSPPALRSCPIAGLGLR